MLTLVASDPCHLWQARICKCWFGIQLTVLEWAFVDVFVSLSPALYSVLVSLVSSSHLGFLGPPAPFPQLGETTGPVWVPPPCSSAWKLSQGSKLGTFVAVSCFLSLRYHCVVSCLVPSVLLFIHFVRFLLFHIRKLNQVPFIHCILIGVMSLWSLGCHRAQLSIPSMLWFVCWSQLWVHSEL